MNKLVNAKKFDEKCNGGIGGKIGGISSFPNHDKLFQIILTYFGV